MAVLAVLNLLGVLVGVAAASCVVFAGAAE
jgi:hypothetical protein